MADSIEFFIDDKPHSARKVSLTVAEVLAIAGLSPDHFLLISQGGTEHLDPKQNIDIHSGDRVTTKKRDHDSKPTLDTVIHYKVNGEQQTTTNATLSVKNILRAAGKSASIDLNQLNSYILENINTGIKYRNLIDIVDITNDDEFLAVHSGATPVAFAPDP